MKQRYLFAALLVAATPLAQAATDTLDEVVVTAARSEQALTKTLTHTSVITRNDIEASQAADVPTLLKSLAGVEIYQSGGTGKQSSLFLRGSNSSHTLVLLDGVRINSATSGTTAIDQLMLDQIERIEVVRGNVSSLYGSEAIGGVIQLFTRRGKGEPSVNGSIGAGSHNTQRASAGYGGTVKDTSFNVQLSKYKTDGVSAINSRIVSGVNPDKDGYDNTSVSLNVRQAFNEAHSAAVSLFDSQGKNQTDNSFGAMTDVNSNKSQVQKASLLVEDRFAQNWLSKLQISRGVDDIQYFLNGVPDLALGARFKTSSDLYSWQNTLQLGEVGVLLAGFDRLRQQVDSSTNFTRTSRTDDSLYAGYTGNYGAQQVQINLRNDKYSDFGNANTWLLGYGINVADAWRVTASTGTAFKAPILNDLFYPFTDYGTFFGVAYSYVGNPNLKPEHSRNKELGLHYAKEGQKLDLVYFENRIHDLIVNNNQPASTMINLDEARIEGAELAYNGKIGDTGFKLAVTQQNPRDAKTGQSLLRRAKNFSSAGVTQQIGSVKLGAEWQHSGVRQDIYIKTLTRTTLAAYDLVNLTASYALDKHFELSARVDNLFNHDYMLAHGYNILGRTVFVGLSYR